MEEIFSIIFSCKEKDGLHVYYFIKYLEIQSFEIKKHITTSHASDINKQLQFQPNILTDEFKQNNLFYLPNLFKIQQRNKYHKVFKSPFERCTETFCFFNK